MVELGNWGNFGGWGKVWDLGVFVGGYFGIERGKTRDESATFRLNSYDDLPRLEFDVLGGINQFSVHFISGSPRNFLQF